jgi:hypothetical protein
MPFLKLYKLNLWVQGIYTLLTALWPIVHIESFMEVSGYKTDIWLVNTVSVLLLSIAVALIVTTTFKQINAPISVLALLVAIGMAYVDFYYALNNTIWNIYMADGVVEILFAVSWLIVLIKYFTQRRKAG